MTQRTLLKRIALSDADFDEIRNAVVDAEKNTNGEIALAITAESSSYAFWELFAASITTFILLLCLLPLAPSIDAWLGTLFWNHMQWHLVGFYILVAFATMAVFYLLYNIPVVDKLVIPVGVRHCAVENRAMRHFAESGVYCTENHSGILIFVSYFEHEVKILADIGISKKITQDLWNLIADEMAASLARKDVKQAFLHAVRQCGDLLAQNFPAGAVNPDEIPDGLVVLENGAVL